MTILALGVTSNINKAELMSISGDSEVREIADFDEFHELAELLLESSEWRALIKKLWHNHQNFSR